MSKFVNLCDDGVIGCWDLEKAESFVWTNNELSFLFLSGKCVALNPKKEQDKEEILNILEIMKNDFTVEFVNKVKADLNNISS